MLDYLTNIVKHPELLTTYNSGLLQTKAFRILKKHTTEMLEPFGLSTVAWALLGMLYDHKKGMRSLVVADMLGVEQPFVTVLTNDLKKKGHVDVVNDPDDGRAKLLIITEEGSKAVPKIEKALRRDIKPIINGISPKELLTFLRVMQSIVDNYDKKEK